MRLNMSCDPAAITARLEPVLAADPVRNTVLSSVIDGLASPDADGWCVHPVGEDSVLAVRSQRYTPVVVTAGWDEFGALADAVAQLHPAALGGPVPVVEGLAAALDVRGLPATSRIDERLFRLDDLTQPRPTAGAARIATVNDRNVLAPWYEAFALEAFGRLPAGFEAEVFLEQTLRRSRFWLWTDPAGTDCAMAGRHPVTFGVARIGPVYTPPRLRGRGFGTAVTAAASRDVLDEDAVAVLYTDLANPTSNKIYQQLGYCPVEDRAQLAFS